MVPAGAACSMNASDCLKVAGLCARAKSTASNAVARGTVAATLGKGSPASRARGCTKDSDSNNTTGSTGGLTATEAMSNKASVALDFGCSNDNGSSTGVKFCDSSTDMNSGGGCPFRQFTGLSAVTTDCSSGSAAFFVSRSCDNNNFNVMQVMLHAGGDDLTSAIRMG